MEGKAMLLKTVFLPAILFLISSYFFAGRLAKEIRDLGIVDITSNIVSLPGVIKYVREKRRRNEPLSVNFFAATASVVLIFVPFIIAGIIY